MSNQDLINTAASVVNRHFIGDSEMGQVGCALLSENDNVYTGVCIDTNSSLGFCAEHTAIASMITAGEYRFKKIVAVWKNNEGILHVLSPCGRCREFMKQTNRDNMEAEVILDRDKTVKLKELLPYDDWWQKVE